MKKGFTIIELMVAMSLFVVVTGITAGTFVHALRTQRNVVALMAANENVSLVLEQMVREMRTGRAFIGRPDGVTFTNYQNEQVTYALHEGILERNNAPLTSSQVLVHYFKVALTSPEPGDGRSTRATIHLGVGAKGRLESFVTRLQTTVSSRILDE